MAMNPALRRLLDDLATASAVDVPDWTYINDHRFGALVEALKGIGHGDDEVIDMAICEALMDVGQIAPASYRETHERDVGL